WRLPMPTEAPALSSASAMAKDLGVSDAKVKKAIQDLGLAAAAKKGCCSFYDAEAMAKLKAFFK
ncbi:MAG: hypothetical protein P4L11_16205, partial [Geothrix sp.]|nr:hypothetical protein [Geothrix sp.]